MIRRATADDAAALVGILEGIAAEGHCTAISKPWSAERQRQYIEALAEREVIHVAEPEAGVIAGYQVLEQWAATLESMAHVGQLGTFLAPAWRGRGIGHRLFEATCAFAREHDYAKFVIQVRAANQPAQSFYRGLGFEPCGRFTGQVRIDGMEDDEILMEYFLLT